MKKLASMIAVAALAALSAAPAMGENGGKVSIARDHCRALVKHVPEKGVAYQPGVDARGKKVVPADVGGGPTWQVPESITISIGIDIAEKFGIGAGGKFKGEAYIAAVTVDTKTGAVLLDGQPVGDAAEAEIVKACREAYGK